MKKILIIAMLSIQPASAVTIDPMPVPPKVYREQLIECQNTYRSLCGNKSNCKLQGKSADGTTFSMWTHWTGVTQIDSLEIRAKDGKLLRKVYPNELDYAGFDNSDTCSVRVTKHETSLNNGQACRASNSWTFLIPPAVNGVPSQNGIFYTPSGGSHCQPVLKAGTVSVTQGLY